ncbi:MAG: metalloregulator ArsR/SmtB family transcription factor [Streptococcaceae bacterium]|jgi:DNA-binding transcriptional ArsR family regulator/predicted transcriptional regulator|nr:metalloregulator ArsR/SmtB family transcription factor [Streptococcaceae bacterium]
MIDQPDLKEMIKLLGDSTRFDLLNLMMDARFSTVHELAKSLKLKDQTISYHLGKMLEADWLESYKQGRNVYYRLANSELAELIEQLSVLKPRVATHSYNQSQEFQAIKVGRTCYHHLAGEMAVDYFAFLEAQEFILLENQQIRLTTAGEAYFSEIGLDMMKLKQSSGTLLKPCMDWTERTFHLSGNIGKAFLQLLEDRAFVVRNSDNRAIKWTERGQSFVEAGYRI